MTASDSDLLHRVAAGRDRQAFGALYDRHAPRVFGLLLRLLRNQTDAEDVLQETFLQVWHQADRFDRLRAAFGGWVLMIARSRALDRLRRRAATPTATTDASEPATEEEAGEQLRREDDAMKLTSALATLPPEQRDLIRMAFFDGLTHEQIARQRQLPLGTVKTRIRLGMIRLRDQLSPEVPE